MKERALGVSHESLSRSIDEAWFRLTRIKGHFRLEIRDPCIAAFGLTKIASDHHQISFGAQWSSESSASRSLPREGYGLAGRVYVAGYQLHAIIHVDESWANDEARRLWIYWFRWNLDTPAVSDVQYIQGWDLGFLGWEALYESMFMRFGEGAGNLCAW